MILLMIGIVIYSWLVSALSKLKNIEYNNYSDEKINDYQKKRDIIDEMKTKYSKISFDLYSRVVRYLKYNFDKERFNPNDILDNLPSTLRKEFLFEMYKPIITKFVL